MQQNLKGKTVLVTGGAGFIGTALSQRLASLVDRWVVMDNLHPQVHPGSTRPASLHSSAELVVADVTSPEDWDRVLGDFAPSIVVHLAAETGTAQSLHEATRHASVNVVGTTQMLDALGRKDVVPEHFVLSSSRAVYGEGEWIDVEGNSFYPGQRSHAQLVAGQWDFEGASPRPSAAARTIPTPTSVYGATKLAQENILSAWTSSHDSALTILRFQNVYGPGQSLINPYTGIVSLFSQMARRGESIPLYEDGQITRDFIYIDDVADSLREVIEHGPRAAPARFDIGFGEATTIRQLATAIAAYHEAPGTHVTAAFRDGDVRHAQVDIAFSLGELDWSPQFDLARGIARLQEWIEGESRDGAE